MSEARPPRRAEDARAALDVRRVRLHDGVDGVATVSVGRYTAVVHRTQPTVTIAVELPRELVGDADEARLGAELRALWAVEQVRLKRCGVGKGAELALLPRAAFMQLLGKHGVAVIDYSHEDLSEELRTLGAP